jgi:DNA replication protein DnaC
MSRPSSEIAFLARALKAPRISARAAALAQRAAEQGWDHQTYLAAVLAEEVDARDIHGGQHRVKAARFPQIKTLDDFDFSFQRSVKQSTMAHLAQLDFLSEASNVIFLGPRPARGRRICQSPWASRRHGGGHPVAFAWVQDWVGRLAAAKRAGKLEDELERLRRDPLVVVDEVGYIPFDSDAAALFFALISSRYERASLIVSSNKTFSAWAEIFGDAVAVAAMVDRLVHHAEVIVLQGDSYRLKDRPKEVLPTKSR